MSCIPLVTVVVEMLVARHTVLIDKAEPSHCFGAISRVCSSIRGRIYSTSRKTNKFKTWVSWRMSEYQITNHGTSLQKSPSQNPPLSAKNTCVCSTLSHGITYIGCIGVNLSSTSKTCTCSSFLALGISGKEAHRSAESRREPTAPSAVAGK